MKPHISHLFLQPVTTIRHLLALSFSIFFLLMISPNLSWGQSAELQAAYREFGKTFMDDENYGESIPIIETILELEEAEFGQEEFTVFLYQLALVAEGEGQSAKAYTVAIILNSLALMYNSEGRYVKAEPLYQYALEISERHLGSEHPDVATVLDNLASLKADQGRYYDAEPLYQRALSMRKKLLGPNHPDVSVTTVNLAVLRMKQGRYVEAEPLYKQSLTILEKSLGPDHSDVATTLHNLANLYNYQGRYEESERLYQRALAIREKKLGPYHPYVGSTLNGMAVLYSKQGRSADAKLLYQRVLAIYETTLGSDDPEIGTTLGNLAQVSKKQGHYLEAESYQQRALEIFEKAFGSNHPLVALGLSNLAVTYGNRGREDEAELLLERSLVIREKLLNPDHPDIATTLNNLAEFYKKSGRFADSESSHKRALEIHEQAFGSDHPRTATTFANLASLFNDQEQFSEAILWIRKSTDILQKRFTRTGIEETPSLLSEQRLERGSFVLHVDLALHPEQASDRAHLEAEAFEVLQLARSSSAAGAISRMAVRFATGTEEMAVVIRERQDALAYFEKLNADLIKVLSETPATRNPESTSRIRAAVEDLEDRLEKLEQNIKDKFPEYAELIRREPLSLLETQSLLQPEEALLTFTGSLEGVQTHVFVARQGQSTAYTVELSANEIEEMVTTLRAGVDASEVQKWEDTPYFDVEIAHKLYHKLLSPAEDILSRTKHLFVVPEGPLESLPLGVLVTKEPKRKPNHLSDYRDIAWLYKDYAITTLPSIASLRALRAFASKTQSTKPFIGFGDPVLGGQSGTSQLPKLATLYRGATADVAKIRDLPNVPGTAQQLRTMAKYLGADDNMIYLREKATETQVKTLPLNKYKVVAFATHGLISGEITGLAEPALVLTPPQEGTVADDGLLTASEAAQLHFDANWVILSACNTAAADKPGAVGLSGLAKAFFYAGARALLVSHWAVESTAAATLTTTMFEKIKKNPTIGRAEALRQSMLQLASSKSEPYYAHPIFWAPFVVVGEGGTTN